MYTNITNTSNTQQTTDESDEAPSCFDVSKHEELNQVQESEQRMIQLEEEIVNEKQNWKRALYSKEARSQVKAIQRSIVKNFWYDSGDPLWESKSLNYAFSNPDFQKDIAKSDLSLLFVWKNWGCLHIYWIVEWVWL